MFTSSLCAATTSYILSWLFGRFEIERRWLCCIVLEGGEREIWNDMIGCSEGFEGSALAAWHWRQSLLNHPYISTNVHPLSNPRPDLKSPDSALPIELHISSTSSSFANHLPIEHSYLPTHGRASSLGWLPMAAQTIPDRPLWDLNWTNSRSETRSEKL